MIRRLGLAAVLVALAVPMLMPDEAAAQRRQQLPSREELGGGTTAIPLPQQEKTFPLGASWSVVALNGKPVQDRRATLMVDQNLRGTGFAGCNTFSASAYPLREQGFAVGPIAITRRSCDKGTLDFDRRKEIYGELQVILHNEGPSVIPVFADFLDAKSVRVKGFEPSGVADLSGDRIIERIWLEA